MQFIKLKEISRRIYLLYCTFTLFLLAEGRKHLTNVKVGIFLDRILHSETSFGNYTQELADFYHNTTLTKISLETQTIQLNGLPFEDISRRFCVDIVQNNISVIVLQTRNLELTQFVGHLASFFKIPAIESVSREPLLSDKVGKSLSCRFKLKILTIFFSLTITLSFTSLIILIISLKNNLTFLKNHVSEDRRKVRISSGKTNNPIRYDFSRRFCQNVLHSSLSLTKRTVQPSLPLKHLTLKYIFANGTKNYVG